MSKFDENSRDESHKDLYEKCVRILDLLLCYGLKAEHVIDTINYLNSNHDLITLPIQDSLDAAYKNRLDAWVLNGLTQFLMGSH
jgi:hypothetical protein